MGIEKVWSSQSKGMDGLTERLGPNQDYRMFPFPPPITYHYITKGLFIAASFTQYIMSTFQQKDYKAY